MKVKRAICALLSVVVFTAALSGCGKAQKDTADPESVPADQVSSTAGTNGPDASVTDKDTQAEDAADGTAGNAAAEAPKDDMQWDTETLKNETGKTLIRCIGNQKGGGGHVSFGIVSSKGTTILADPIYSTKDGYIRTDILTVSHGHSDHYNQKLQSKMKDHARLSYFTPESFTVDDVNVTGVAASHSSDAVNESRPSNVIYVYELDGLRIAHMGDMGQDELTADQLEKLGQLDIIFTVISNETAYGFATQKNINIIQQLNPKIVIPTHYDENLYEETLKALGIQECERAAELAVSKDELKDAPMRFIFLE
jgi:L-ascorbate metabolism protein UlaG (beta-lactamase superfamily)